MSHTVTMLCCLTITINSRHVIHRAMSIAAPGQPGITLGFSLTVSKGLLCSCVFFSIAAVLKAVTHLQENARGAQQWAASYSGGSDVCLSAGEVHEPQGGNDAQVGSASWPQYLSIDWLKLTDLFICLFTYWLIEIRWLVCWLVDWLIDGNIRHVCISSHVYPTQACIIDSRCCRLSVLTRCMPSYCLSVCLLRLACLACKKLTFTAFTFAIGQALCSILYAGSKLKHLRAHCYHCACVTIACVTFAQSGMILTILG